MTVDAQAVALTFLSQILLGRFGEALRARLRRRSAPSRNASGRFLHNGLAGMVMRPKTTPATPDRALRTAPRRTIGVRRLRLASGLVLFTYVTLHYLDHALGNISVEAMEKGARDPEAALAVAPRRAPALRRAPHPHEPRFLGALRAATVPLERLEATQLALGLTIPFLLADHVFGTRVALSLFGADKGYAAGALQVQLLVAIRPSPGHPPASSCGFTAASASTSGSSLKPFYPRVKSLLLSGAVLVPTLALLGFAARRAPDLCRSSPTQHGGRRTSRRRMSGRRPTTPGSLSRPHGHAHLSRRDARGRPPRARRAPPGGSAGSARSGSPFPTARSGRSGA